MGITSFKILHICIALLVGLYVGINLSSFHHLTSFDGSSTVQRSGLQLPYGSINENNQHQQLNNNALKASQAQTKQWKDKARQLEKDYTSSINKIQEIEKSCTVKQNDIQSNNNQGQERQIQDTFTSTTNTNPHPFCQAVMSIDPTTTTPSAVSLWYQNILNILEASRVPNDRKYQFHDFTTQLLQIITPRLPRSVKTIPYDWKPVEHALTIGWKRYQYLQLPIEKRKSITDKPRPIKMLIMGGSLLVGTNCRMLLTELNLQFRLPKRDCTWSNRVGQFMNALFHASEDEPLIEVTKVAMGGTNTATGSIIWQYDLIPPEARDPDIVLNAYSTNDMHILTILEAQSSNTTLRDRIFDMIQNFVRQVMDTKHCSDKNVEDNFSNEPIPPLLLHMDDYLGNEQRKIWETTELSQGVQVLANYYGFASMSYADVVRDLVYGDTYETWFSSEWWKKESKNNQNELSFEREIHPGMGMHIASTWVTAYNLLNLASTFCSMPAPYQPSDISQYEPGLWGLPNLKEDVKQAKGKPKPQPNGLPPELTQDLLLEDVTSLWKQSAAKAGPSMPCAADLSRADSGHSRLKCPFSWVSGLSLQQNNITWIQEYFEQHATTWNRWKISDDGGKVGFVPTTMKGERTIAPNTTQMVLDFTFSQRIRSITFFFMKSYGDKWLNSQLETKIWKMVDNAKVASNTGMILEERHLYGTHDKETSEMYTEEIILQNPVEAGENLKLGATLIGGQMFKIMGLAICS